MTNIIKAKDTEIGKNYLLVISPSSVYKITIKSVNLSEDNSSCRSVVVSDERYSNGPVTISPDTSLLVWDEELYRKSKKLNSPKKETDKKDKNLKTSIKQTQSKEKEMPKTSNPRSKVIDSLLENIPADNKPDFQDIATNVISKIDGASEDDRKKIIAQSRVRWYNMQKKNNAAPVSEGSIPPSENS